jgi:hypothetical protein
MTESTTEDGALVAERFVKRVEDLYGAVRGWCVAHGLIVKDAGFVTLRHTDMPDFDVPCMEILNDGKWLARLEPVAARVIRAEGRVDLEGQLARHPLIFRVPNGPLYHKSGLMFPRGLNQWGLPKSTASCDGWYWTESLIRRQKPIDESLFLDLITDVSDHEF